MATDLVTLAQVQAHLKLDDATLAAEADDLSLKLAQATALVLTHIAREDNDWDALTDPTVDLEFAIVQASILDLVGELYRFRGDDADPRPEPVEAGAYLKPNLRRKLHALRRPSLA